MNKVYNPLDFEEQIYEKWLNAGYFHANENSNKTPFTIIMPPPNITSKLHMGHAFQQTIQDIIIRRKRMQGYEALWLPGTDHAAIATEAKVVEKLEKEGLTKEKIGRAEFSKHIDEWYKLYKNTIISQFKKMGYSCDWDRLSFTMDESNSKAVRYVFCYLYNKGLIYRGNRMVNWCPKCKTSISDAEVDFKDNNSYLWHLRYQIKGTEDYISFATTRPETMLGDTAVAVNPKDKRYTNLVGKTVIVPIVNREIPIIADEYVEMDFGTGVVKITPAHDPNDFEVGLRHNLEVINILNKDGTINEVGGKYQGLDRFVAREKIVEQLKSLGNLVKIEKYSNSVGHCDRCKSVLEPMVSLQWFVKMDELSKPAIKVVEDDEVHFNTQRHKKIYLHWMKNIKDWCISRQLWSGHRIPIFTCQDCGNVMVEMEDVTECNKCHSHNVLQDEDTLDTWFSSALWPLSTLGFPNKTKELEYFYPTNVMVTAQEIIQLWVARMIFSGLEYVGKIPFKEVVINGTIKDANGKKMSKSLGNGVDPIEIIDKYGVDTLRFSLFNGVSIDMDSRFSEKKVEINRNFINKIWNASLFVLQKFEGKEVKQISQVKLTTADKWILNELNLLVKNTNKKFEKFDLGMVASTLCDFFWTKFCDWYIEIAKVNIANSNEESTLAVLNYVLTNLLKMLHPFIPFITEKIYLELPFHDESIMISSFPEYDTNLNFKVAHKNFEIIRETIKNIRNVRTKLNVADNKKVYFEVFSDNTKLIQENLKIIEKLAYGKDIILLKNEKINLDNQTTIVNELMKVYIKNNDLVDESKELERLNAELNRVESEINRAFGKLNNAGFVNKAPQSLIDEEKAKLEKYNTLKVDLQKSIEVLNK